ncbi:hypothetical protein LTR95_015113 [Oleoguttula sp. CCFEE 5521]
MAEKDWMSPRSDTPVSARVKWWNSKAAGDALSLQQTPPERYVRANKFKDLLNSFGRKSLETSNEDAEPKGCFGLFGRGKKSTKPEPISRYFTVKHTSIQAEELRRAQERDLDAQRLLELQQGEAPPATERLHTVVSSKPQIVRPSPAFSIVPSLYVVSERKEEGLTTAPTTHARASAGSEANATALPVCSIDLSRRSVDSDPEEVETGQEAVSQRPLSWYRMNSKNSNNRKRSRPDKGAQHIHSSSSSYTSTTSSASLVPSTSTRSSSPPSTVAVQGSPIIKPACRVSTALARAPSSASPAYVSDDKGNIERVASVRAKATMDTTDSKTGLAHPSSLIPGGSGQRSFVTRKPVPGSRPTSVVGWTPLVPLWQQPANTATFSKYTAYNPGFKSFADSMSEDPWYQTPGESAEESNKYRSDKDLDAEMPDFDAKSNAAAVKHLADFETGVVGDEFRAAAQYARQLRSSQRSPHLKRSSAVSKPSTASSPRSATTSPRTPKPHRMNSNRYPVHSPETARRFSAKPVYSRGGQDKGKAWDQKRKEDKALADKERKEGEKLALKEAKAHTEKQAGKPCEGCDNCKGADVGKNMLIY